MSRRKAPRANGRLKNVPTDVLVRRAVDEFVESRLRDLRNMDTARRVVEGYLRPPKR